MYKALLFKEWLKTRRIFGVAMIISILAALYAIMQMRALIDTRGMTALWLAMLQKDVSFVSILTYIPLISGIAIGVAQMAPEMAHKRLKLTIHLPLPTVRLITTMLSVGVMQLIAVFIVQAAIIAVYDAHILPSELVGRVLLTMLPWYLAGIIAYLFVSAICLEGTWAMRVTIAVLAVAVLMAMYLRPDAMEAYNAMFFTILIFISIITVLTFGSVIRFKEGLQD